MYYSTKVCTEETGMMSCVYYICRATCITLLVNILGKVKSIVICKNVKNIYELRSFRNKNFIFLTVTKKNLICKQ